MTKLEELFNNILELDKKAKEAPWDVYFETGLHPFLITFYENDEGMRALKDSVKTNWDNLSLTAYYRNNTPKLAEASKLMDETLTDVRSELTHAPNNIDTGWCVDAITDCLASVAKILEKSNIK